MSIILVDIDGTIADWGAAYDKAIDAHGEAAANIRRHAQQLSFNLHEGLSEAESAIVRSVMDQEGFYRDLDPIPGAVEALQDMLDEDHDVFLVTSPWVTNPTCASDKMQWAMRHLGEDWGRRTIISSDKTVVVGDVLFDDKPSITGKIEPVWKHVLFHQPYNVGVDAKQPRIQDWAHWRDHV